jgi:signal transduction histidine kinase
MEIRSLQTEGFRLSAIYIAIFALSVLSIGVAVIMIADHALREQILQSARTDILAMQRAYDQEGLEEVREVIGQLKGAPDASELFLLQQDGRRISGNLEAMPARAGVLELTVGVRHDAVLGVGASIAPGLYVFSGSRLARVEQVHARILHTLLWLFLAALLLAVLGGVLVSRSFLGRTDAMARACRIIMDGELKARLPIRGTGDELDRLAAAVNAMLDRIAVLMLNLGQVTNDIAHDIRTPLTHLRQRLESGKRDSTTVAQYDAALDGAIEKTDEILGLCAALLRIVQIEAGSRSKAFTTLSLATLVTQVHDMFAPVAEGAGHTLIWVAGDGDAILAGDRSLLVQMLANLIENAIIHTPDGTHIWLRLTRPEPGKVAVTVADDGPGVPREEYAKLFQRLYRREASRTTPGYGLGLSLVAAIAELHGAKVEIEPGAPAARGLSVRITFNTCAPAHRERVASVSAQAEI